MRVKSLLTAVLVLGLAVGAFSQRVLNVYTAFDVDQAQVYFAAFERAHPDIKVEWVRLSAGALLARLRAEFPRPGASLWLAGPSDTHIVAAAEGMLEAYTESLAWQYLPPWAKCPDGYWAGIYTGFIGFATNTEFLARHGLEPPTSWHDLLKPEYANNVSMAYPYTSGTGYTRLAAFVFLMGEEAGLEFERKLSEHAVHHYTASGSAPATEAGLGEVAVGIAFSHDILARGIGRGYPVVMSFPKEGTGYEVGAISLIKNGPEPELAKVFYDWMMSAEAQSLYQAWYRVPLNPESEIHPAAVTAADVALVDYDFIWAAENRDRLCDLWQELTGF